MFGVADQLAEFADERTLTRDLRWFADMTIGPDGQCMAFEDRIHEDRLPARDICPVPLDLQQVPRGK